MDGSGNGIIMGVIPARGGSKGIPQKNIQPLLGRPLITYTMEAAKNSQAIDVLLVSTDSEEIAGLAENEGVWVPFIRPAKLASDEAATWPVLKHAIEFHEETTGQRVHSVVTLQPTTPFRRATDIDQALTLYRDHQPDANCLISACRAGHMHPLTLYFRDEPWARPFLPGKNHTQRRQDWDPVFWRNGAIYISRRELIMDQHQVVGARPLCYEMPIMRSLSIDTLYDLKVAELQLKHLDWLEEVGP